MRGQARACRRRWWRAGWSAGLVREAHRVYESPSQFALIIYPSLAWAPPPMFSDGRGYS